jgi:hypothetical protein
VFVLNLFICRIWFACLFLFGLTNILSVILGLITTFNGLNWFWLVLFFGKAEVYWLIVSEVFVHE